MEKNSRTLRNRTDDIATLSKPVRTPGRSTEGDRDSILHPFDAGNTARSAFGGSSLTLGGDVAVEISGAAHDRDFDAHDGATFNRLGDLHL